MIFCEGGGCLPLVGKFDLLTDKNTTFLTGFFSGNFLLLYLADA
jgi:hypothetical protein